MKVSSRPYADIEYFYENLNSTRFWNWRHPLEHNPEEGATRGRPRPSNRETLKAKLNLKML